MGIVWLQLLILFFQVSTLALQSRSLKKKDAKVPHIIKK